MKIKDISKAVLVSKLYNHVKDKTDLTSLGIKACAAKQVSVDDMLQALYDQAIANEQKLAAIISENLLKEVCKTVLLSK